MAEPDHSKQSLDLLRKEKLKQKAVKLKKGSSAATASFAG